MLVVVFDGHLPEHAAIDIEGSPHGGDFDESVGFGGDLPGGPVDTRGLRMIVRTPVRCVVVLDDGPDQLWACLSTVRRNIEPAVLVQAFTRRLDIASATSNEASRATKIVIQSLRTSATCSFDFAGRVRSQPDVCTEYDNVVRGDSCEQGHQRHVPETVGGIRRHRSLVGPVEDSSCELDDENDDEHGDRAQGTQSSDAELIEDGAREGIAFRKPVNRCESGDSRHEIARLGRGKRQYPWVRDGWEPRVPGRRQSRERLTGLAHLSSTNSGGGFVTRSISRHLATV